MTPQEYLVGPHLRGKTIRLPVGWGLSPPRISFPSKPAALAPSRRSFRTACPDALPAPNKMHMSNPSTSLKADNSSFDANGVFQPAVPRASRSPATHRFSTSSSTVVCSFHLPKLSDVWATMGLSDTLRRGQANGVRRVPTEQELVLRLKHLIRALPPLLLKNSSE